MPTVTELVRTLSDPVPPVPTAETPALVHARATGIARRRRAQRALGAIAGVACVALVAMGIAAVTDTASGRRGVDVAVADRSVALVSVDTGDAVTPDVELEATLVGEGGTFHAHVRTPGMLSFDAVPPGDYELRWSWSSDDGTAAGAARRPVHVDSGDITFTL